MAQVNAGTVRTLTVEYKDGNPYFFAEVVYTSQGKSKNLWGYRRLDEGTSEITMTLTLIQLLRDAMANNWTVWINTDSTDKIWTIKVYK